MTGSVQVLTLLSAYTFVCVCGWLYLNQDIYTIQQKLAMINYEYQYIINAFGAQDLVYCSNMKSRS